MDLMRKKIADRCAHHAVKKIEKLFNITIHDTDLVAQSLVHPSVGGQSFQRLEFLGDRALGLIISAWIFERHPEDSEGLLTKRLSNLVNRQSLLEIAYRIQLEKYLSFDAQSMDKERIISDGLESLLGALFIDQGIENVSNIVRDLWSTIINKYIQPTIDPKSSLQESLQSINRPLPTYQLLEQSGKSHHPYFKMSVSISLPEKKVFFGEGYSKKKAEQNAAESALNFIKTKH